MAYNSNQSYASPYKSSSTSRLATGANRLSTGSLTRLPPQPPTMAFSGAANPTQGDLKGDVEVANPPTDSVSALRFSPTADYLSVSSWDNHVRIYEVKGDGTTEPKAAFQHDGPALDTCWSPVSPGAYTKWRIS